MPSTVFLNRVTLLSAKLTIGCGDSGQPYHRVLLLLACCFGLMAGELGRGAIAAQPSDAPLPILQPQVIPLETLPSTPFSVPPSLAAPIPGTQPLASPDPFEADRYRLAIGDRIFVSVANVPEFSAQYSIMMDGAVILPIVGRVSLWGMTAEEAAQTVTQRYTQADVLRDPTITVQVLASSPLKIALVGEVNRPGAYNLPLVDNKLPTLTEAIAFAGGITGQADLRQVKILRLQRSGPDQQLQANLWAMLESGDLQQDMTLRSGDRIILGKIAVVSPSDAYLLGATNLAPTAMQVGILGEVLKPGILQITPNTSLNQVLLSVGGFNQRAQRKSLELIRLETDGTVTRRKIAVDLSASINEETNPILRSRDVVIVGSSTLARYNDLLGKILAPISPSLSFLSLFRLLFPSLSLP